MSTVWMHRNTKHSASSFVAGCSAKSFLLYRIDCERQNKSQSQAHKVATDVRQRRMFDVSSSREKRYADSYGCRAEMFQYQFPPRFQSNYSACDRSRDMFCPRTDYPLRIQRIRDLTQLLAPAWRYA
jgi:hypothetical protein